MIVTLHDHLLAGGEWPAEIDQVEKRPGHQLARCTCGRVRSPRSIYLLDPENVPVAERIPGRVRRSRMSRDLKKNAEEAARQRHRREVVPHVSPLAACNVCLGAYKAAMGLTHQEFDRRLGR